MNFADDNISRPGVVIRMILSLELFFGKVYTIHIKVLFIPSKCIKRQIEVLGSRSQDILMTSISGIEDISLPHFSPTKTVSRTLVHWDSCCLSMCSRL